MPGSSGSSEPAPLPHAFLALPVFPLPGTVFFPHTLLPLHVFEPRYRQMTEHVLAGDQHIAVALIDKACEGPLRGVAQVAGLGRIVHHERLPDGRFHVLLQGVGRVGFLEELPMGDLLYRRARADVLSPQAAGDEASALADEVTTLRSCYARLLDAHPECKDTLGDLPLRITDPAVLADIVCAALLDDLPARQAALEEKSLVVRLKTANNALATLLLRSLSCSPSSVN